MYNFRTDRSEDDVIYALYLQQAIATKGYDALTEAEKANWNSDLKGFYNTSDLERVQSALKDFDVQLNTHGIRIEVIPDLDISYGFLLTADMMTFISQNVIAIQNALTFPSTMPAAPTSLLVMNFNKANIIEQILSYLQDILTTASTHQIFSGELFSGEVGL